MILIKLKQSALSLVMLNMLIACAPTLPVNSFCEIYQPVFISTLDTEETKQQIDINNVVWLELCN